MSQIATFNRIVINLLTTPTKVNVVADTIPLQSHPVYLVSTKNKAREEKKKNFGIKIEIFRFKMMDTYEK